MKIREIIVTSSCRLLERDLLRKVEQLPKMMITNSIKQQTFGKELC